MAIETARGCGFRTAGGIYLVGKGMGVPCDRLPFELAPCPTCAQGIKRARAFQWVQTSHALAKAPPCRGESSWCRSCPLCTLLSNELTPKGKFGLLWIGEKFYPTVAAWEDERNAMGISRRIPAVPKDFVPGQTWVLMAHPKAISKTEMVQRDGELHPSETTVDYPGVIHVFRPTIEVVVTPAMKSEKWAQDLVKKYDAKLVEVPEDDPDHMPKAAKVSARRRSMDQVAMEE